MCELFAMSARKPSSVNAYLEALGAHGGGSGPYADGWGIAWYEGRAALVFKEREPAAHGRCFTMLTATRRESALALAHVRKANPPDVGRAWANNAPVRAGNGGALHVFAMDRRVASASATFPWLDTR